METVETIVIMVFVAPAYEREESRVLLTQISLSFVLDF